MTTTTSGVVIPEFTIGDRLRKARELTGLDQQRFADEIGISRQSVSNYELGNTKRYRKIVFIAWQMRTGVPVEWLEHGRFTEPPAEPSRLMPFSSPIPGNMRDENAPRLGTAEIKAHFAKRIPLRPPVREPGMRTAVAI